MGSEGEESQRLQLWLSASYLVFQNVLVSGLYLILSTLREKELCSLFCLGDWKTKS